MTATAFKEELLKRPDLPTLFQQLKTHLEDESARRVQFREWLDEDKKAEFINGEIILHSPVKRRHLRVPANKLIIGQTLNSTAIPGFEIPVLALFDEVACAEALQALTTA